ncbi:MAG: hypothetical protein RBS68_05905 [Anaerolineales bacterium]|jgi:hypothetical protein|nr:hypothetical protein [Anaerolineales bacterium]
MSINDAVANILAASKHLSPAATPVLHSWLREQSNGAVLRVCPNQLSAWLSSLHPQRMKAEHDSALAQINYLAWLLPHLKPKNK